MQLFFSFLLSISVPRILHSCSSNRIKIVTNSHKESDRTLVLFLLYKLSCRIFMNYHCMWSSAITSLSGMELLATDKRHQYTHWTLLFCLFMLKVYGSSLYVKRCKLLCECSSIKLDLLLHRLFYFTLETSLSL